MALYIELYITFQKGLEFVSYPSILNTKNRFPETYPSLKHFIP